MAEDGTHLDLISKRGLDARRWLPVGMLISNIGNGMHLLAVGVILYQSTGGAGAFAALVSMEMAAAVVTELFAGAGADRGFAQSLAATAEGLRALLVVGSGIVALLGFPEYLILAGVLTSVLRPFYRTSVFRIAPLVAQGDDLAGYNARVSAFQQTGQIVGVAAAGALIAVTPTLPIFINAVTYVISGVVIATAAVPGMRSMHRRDVFGLFAPKSAAIQWWAALTTVFRLPHLVVLLVLGATNSVITSFVNLVYAPLLEDHGASSIWLSWWDGACALGSIVAALSFGRWAWMHRSRALLVGCVAAQALLLAVLAGLSPVLAGAAFFGLGSASALSNTVVVLATQRMAPAAVLGRVSGLRQLAMTAATVSMLPWLASSVSVRVHDGSVRAAIISAVTAVLMAVLLRGAYWRRGEAG